MVVLIVTLLVSNAAWYALTTIRSRRYTAEWLDLSMQYATYYVVFNVLYKGLKGLDEEHSGPIFDIASSRKTAARIEKVIENMTGYEVAVDNLSIVANNPEKQNAE